MRKHDSRSHLAGRRARAATEAAPLDFSLTDEQQALQATARRFAQTEIAPAAARYDQTGEFPMEVMRKAWELGLSSGSIPTEYGGVGLSLFDAVLVVEELAWGCAGMATSIMCNDLGLTPILIGGSAATGFNNSSSSAGGTCGKRRSQVATSRSLSGTIGGPDVTSPTITEGNGTKTIGPGRQCQLWRRTANPMDTRHDGCEGE